MLGTQVNQVSVAKLVPFVHFSVEVDGQYGTVYLDIDEQGLELAASDDGIAGDLRLTVEMLVWRSVSRCTAQFAAVKYLDVRSAQPAAVPDILRETVADELRAAGEFQTVEHIRFHGVARGLVEVSRRV